MWLAPACCLLACASSSYAPPGPTPRHATWPGSSCYVSAVNVISIATNTFIRPLIISISAVSGCAILERCMRVNLLIERWLIYLYVLRQLVTCSCCSASVRARYIATISERWTAHGSVTASSKPVVVPWLHQLQAPQPPRTDGRYIRSIASSITKQARTHQLQIKKDSSYERIEMRQRPYIIISFGLHHNDDNDAGSHQVTTTNILACIYTRFAKPEYAWIRIVIISKTIKKCKKQGTYNNQLTSNWIAE
jgi:hypothetical protein